MRSRLALPITYFVTSILIGGQLTRGFSRGEFAPFRTVEFKSHVCEVGTNLRNNMARWSSGREQYSIPRGPRIKTSQISFFLSFMALYLL